MLTLITCKRQINSELVMRFICRSCL